MPFPDVLKRGDDFFHHYPRESKWWKLLHYSTSVFVIGVSKLILKIFYNVKVNNFNNLTKSLEKSNLENRGFLTVMNHMSTMDDPFVWASFPMKLYSKLSHIRFCLGAHNICFVNKWSANFFTLGGVLSTERFGKGPFQGSIDCAIKILSKNDNDKALKDWSNWVHIYPEAFVLQLHPPFNNSMRYFKWGVARMILEASKPPIIVPIFGTGFEKIATEDDDVSMWKHFVKSWGTNVDITVGEPIKDDIINSYRNEWSNLIKKYSQPGDTDLNDILKYGPEAQDLRSRVASELRLNVSNVRKEHSKLIQGLNEEDPRFKDHKWWKLFTQSEGKSDPDVKFIGQNWAIRRLHDFLNLNIKTNEPSGKDNSVNPNDNDIKKVHELEKKNN